MIWNTSPWDGFLVKRAAHFNGSGGRVPAGAPRAMPGNASARERTKRDQALRSRCPATGSINPNSPDWCPTAGGPGSNSNRRTGPGTKGYVNSVAPFRAACGAQCQIRSGSIPSWGLSGERIILTVIPGQNRDRAPRFLWPETLDKSQTTQSLSPAPEPQKRACGTPPAISTKLFTATATPSPSTSATVPGSGRAWPTPGASAF